VYSNSNIKLIGSCLGLTAYSKYLNTFVILTGVKHEIWIESKFWALPFHLWKINNSKQLQEFLNRIHISHRRDV